MEERSLKYSMDAEQQNNDSVSIRTRTPICIPSLVESIPELRKRLQILAQRCEILISIASQRVDVVRFFASGFFIKQLQTSC
jgi:hypothetical protein